MENIRVNNTFISEKVTKIRWIPEQYDESSAFVTGSWEGNLKVWKLFRNDYSEDENEFVPKCTAEICFPGDINGLEFINNEFIAAATSEGFVSVVHMQRDIEHDNLKEFFKFDNLHTFNGDGNVASCAGISVFEENIASVGEDGSLKILSCGSQKVARSFDNADSLSISCVLFVSHKDILTGNRLGIIKCFDARSESDKPTNILNISCRDEKRSNGVTCLAYHPTQKHIVLGGSEEGSITVWDLRQPLYPASYLSAHEQGITEIAFHRTQPSKLFTASENGELWQWNQNTINTSINNENESNNAWLNGERAKNKINVVSLLSGIRKSINSFDSFRSKLICAGDNEAIYLLDNMY